MKKSFIFLSFFLLQCIFAQEALKVEYEYVVKPNGINNSRRTEAFQKTFEEQSKIPEKQILYYYKGNMFYRNFEKPEIIINGENSKEGNTTTRYKERMTFPVFRFYKNKGDENIYELRTYPKVEQFYHYYKPTWEQINYKDETIKIDKLECKLVELIQKNGKVIKVWYTEMLPINAGPLGYYNFPGLVLKVETDTYVCYATSINNHATEKDIEKLDVKLQVYSGNEYDKKVKEIRDFLSKPSETRREIKL
ncbi:GLPGLI family protein [Elizabethkingia meningoseptica]|uniref:GLPGLI family protein n=1 Tax=Elizabethkingia meningoseptica TaxID=238 RepID=UPI0038917D64